MIGTTVSDAEEFNGVENKWDEPPQQDEDKDEEVDANIHISDKVQVQPWKPRRSSYTCTIQ